jgi:hypothetical protein
MLLIGTMIVLAFWLSFVWLVDPDGLLKARVRGRDATRSRPSRYY